MTPHRRRSIRHPLAATAALMVIALGTIPASAQPAPPPAGSQDPMQRYQELGAQASNADEDLLESQDRLRTREADRDKAKAALDQANSNTAKAEADVAAFRPQVDAIVRSALSGQQLSGAVALLDSGNRQEYLDRTAALSVLADNRGKALNGLREALTKAESSRTAAADAQEMAQLAANDAAWAVEQVSTRKKDLNVQIAKVREALNDLPSSDKAKLGKVQDNGSYLGPPGAANNALQAALSKRGSEYEWGATGPGEFDCSGLTSWAYKQAGVNIPRTSRQQYTAGKAVALDQLIPGDLVFYDDGTDNPGAIHHVGMYVGGGKMVDAPTEGQLVDVRSVKGDGHLMGARRIVG
ncbi:NlpC/P60 family protein [Amycolatopsis roodepoortensis]|uniref:C40 family peptidase n=1 Tax=Amycolatopsis roodepoortensis TaxID=700274 RepID=UPI00214C5C4C|nr:C40 family peptidase [Amycolatopsis roodepoortensis]UUV28696.1 NlpC/P60 family protein [Amycolatopsis roodepoortensis]